MYYVQCEGLGPEKGDRVEWDFDGREEREYREEEEREKEEKTTSLAWRLQGDVKRKYSQDELSDGAHP